MEINFLTEADTLNEGTPILSHFILTTSVKTLSPYIYTLRCWGLEFQLTKKEKYCMVCLICGIFSWGGNGGSQLH